LYVGDVHQYGHSYGINQQPALYHTPYMFPQQVNAWAPHNNFSQGQWSYNLPPDLSVQGGYVRILGGEMVTSIRGVETIMKPEDFLRLSEDERRAIVTAAGPYRNNAGPLPPPPPPPPPPPAKIELAVVEDNSTTASDPEAESGPSTAAANFAGDEKKCQLCELNPRVTCIDGVRICSGCYQFHSYLMAENAMKQKPAE
jgi:hypothetical protein